MVSGFYCTTCCSIKTVGIGSHSASNQWHRHHQHLFLCLSVPLHLHSLIISSTSNSPLSFIVVRSFPFLSCFVVMLQPLSHTHTHIQQLSRLDLVALYEKFTTKVQRVRVPMSTCTWRHFRYTCRSHNHLAAFRHLACMYTVQSTQITLLLSFFFVIICDFCFTIHNELQFWLMDELKLFESLSAYTIINFEWQTCGWWF